MRKRNTQLIMATIVLVFLGVSYAWSLFVQPLESTFGWSRSDTSMVFSLTTAFFCFGTLVSGIITRKINVRILLIVCAVMQFVGMVGSGLTKELWQMYLSYGLVCGLSNGLAYNSIISTVNRWYGKKVGFSSGIMMMGYGMGGFVLGSVISLLQKSIGWRNTFFVLAIIFGSLLFVLAFLIQFPEGKDLKSVEYSEETKSYTPIEMMKSRHFQAFYIWAILKTSVGYAIIGHVSMTAATITNSITFQVIATGILSICNGVSRFLFGIIYDKKGRKLTMELVCIMFTVGLVLICLSLSSKSEVVLLLGVVIAGSGYGGSIPCNSSFTREYFGYKYYSTNFGLASSNGILGALLGPTLVSYVLLATESYAYSYAMLIILIIFAYVAQRLIKD